MISHGVRLSVLPEGHRLNDFQFYLSPPVPTQFLTSVLDTRPFVQHFHSLLDK